jgi:uncharacterized protein YbjT (DUF2867 family)
MIGKIAAVIGSTGMIGNSVLKLLLEDDYFGIVRVIVRRPMERSHPKMEVKLVDFKDAESLKLALEGTDAVFSCIGTTNSKVKGDKQLYRSIDVDIPVRAARFAKEAGCEKFLMVSAVGANINSSNSYLKIKGEAEEGVRASGINTIHIFRPSMLFGNRKENRPVERFMQSLFKGINFLVPSKYKGIEGDCIAKAMVVFSKKDDAGFHLHHYNEIKAFC